MALTDVQGAASEPATPAAGRIKAVAPAAAAAGVVGAIVIGALLVGSPGSNAPADPPGAAAPQTAGPPGGDPGLVAPQFNQPPGPGPVQRDIEIVVKFKDDGKVKDIIDAFWRDQGSARAKFEAWKSGRTEFGNLRLARVTYSNELVLVHDGSGAPAERLAALRAITARLAALPDVSYAEQQGTMAHPGGQ